MQVKCDNITVAQVLTSGKREDYFLATCATIIWMVAVQVDIDLSYRHIQVKENRLADLSRWQQVNLKFKSYTH